MPLGGKRGVLVVDGSNKEMQTSSRIERSGKGLEVVLHTNSRKLTNDSGTFCDR